MQMAKIITERAYIESLEEDDTGFSILIHIKSDSDHIYAGKVDLDRQIPWIHLNNSENGDLEINNSEGMENNRWDHITHYILGRSDE